MSKDLKNKTVRGSIFMGGLTMLIRPINIVGNILLARILDPDDFGTVALALVLLSTSYLFAGFGMGAALVQSKYDNKTAGYHALVITIITGVLMYLACLLSVNTLASFLGDPSITPVLIWLLPLILLTAMRLVPEAMLQKDLNFGRLSTATLISEVGSTLFSLVLAYMGFGLWSLVGGQLLAGSLRVIVAWVLQSDYSWVRPRPFDPDVLKDLLSYGSKTTTSGLITYFHTHADDWYVGRIFGTTSLGYYSKAYDFSNRTLASLSRSMINSVFFASYAKMQDDPKRQGRVYLKSVSVVMLMMVPLALGMMVLANELVEVVLGDKWLPMVATLEIYAFMVLFRPISTNTSPVFMAAGKPEYMIRSGILLSVVMVVAGLLLTPYGIAGIAIAVVLSHFVGAIYNLYQVNTVLPNTGLSTVKVMIPALVSGFLMAAVVYFAKPVVNNWLSELPEFISLTVLIVLGAAVYIGASLVLQRDLLLEMLQLTMSSSGKIGSRLTRFVPQRN